jgi:hypothetical protein
MIWPFVSAVRLEPGLLLDSNKKPTENMAAPITASGPVAATSSAPGWTEAGGRDHPATRLAFWRVRLADQHGESQSKTRGYWPDLHW